MNICIFGDSITYGYFDEKKEGGWANRLRVFLDSRDDFNDEVYNLGISGNTTEGVLAHFDSETSARKPDLILFEIGINDSAFLISKNGSWVPIEKFEENVERLIEKSKKISKELIFVGLMPVEENKTSPVPWATDVVYKNAAAEKYNNKIKEICQKENVKFIDLYGELTKMDYKKMLQDGLHPNSEGHKWIAEKVIKELKF